MADIYYYITTELDPRNYMYSLAAYGGVALQRFEFIKMFMERNGLALKYSELDHGEEMTRLDQRRENL